MISIQRFITLGRWEGTSLLLLMGVAMPLKYMFDYPAAVRVVGMAHGILFLAYCAAALLVARKEQWGISKIARCLIASCLPFGTFVFERELRAQSHITPR